MDVRTSLKGEAVEAVNAARDHGGSGNRLGHHRLRERTEATGNANGVD